MVPKLIPIKPMPIAYTEMHSNKLLVYTVFTIIH